MSDQRYMNDGESITAIGSGWSGVLSDAQFLEYVACWVEGDGSVRDNADLIINNLRGHAARMRAETSLAGLKEQIIAACVRHYLEAPPHTDPGMGCRLCLAVKALEVELGKQGLGELLR